MDKFQFEDTLKEMKAQFFASKYSTIEQFSRYSGLWDSELDPNRVSHWNNEKRLFLQKRLAKDTALGETYKMNLTERLSLTSQVIDLIGAEIQNMVDLDPKGIKSLVDTFEKLTTIQDRTISLLKIDAIKDDEFNKNKSSILDELKGKPAKPNKPKKGKGV